MSPSIGHISVQLPRTGQYEVRPYSDHLTRLIDQVSYVLNVSHYGTSQKRIVLFYHRLFMLCQHSLWIAMLLLYYVHFL